MRASKRCRPNGAFLGVAAVAAGWVAIAEAQVTQRLDPLVVTATRVEERAFDLPVAIDSIDASLIQRNQLQLNLSESLVRVPGVVAANRNNYAQDLMVSIRGFGARANFGVRSVRLFQDNIPATMPDGQGQTGSFSLVSAKRIEVLRGPFSALYGNASGGVISVFTEDGTDPPQAKGEIVGGSYGTYNAILKGEGVYRGVGYVVAGNHFATDGFRDHSEASRSLANAKVTFDGDPDTRVTLIGNSLYQPEAQDPLGLTRAEWEADPRQADPAATQFNTRKTVNQTQGGATLERHLSANADLRVTGYGGRRLVRQYLALAGTLATSSGGVTDLNGDFGGVDARVTGRFLLGGGPLTVTAGTAYDSQHQRRKGFVNNNGDLGELRRDEDDYVSSTDGYLQAEWWPEGQLSVLAGARYSDVRFKSDDHYINDSNPDDSGRVSYNHFSPVAGAVWHAAPELNFYVNWGEGFETPSFIELAYRNVGTGLNFDLRPAISRSAEAGVKAYLFGRQRLNVAVFTTRTSDEIVIDTATGGRTTYKNASKTRRRGVEAEWDAPLPNGFNAYASYTYLSAEFASDATTGVPPQPIPAGSRLPGVPQASAFAELAWAKPEWYGINAAIEGQYSGKIYVNDRNTDAAPSYAIANARLGFEQTTRAWTFREFVRVNNLFDRNYVGSVIVGDTNGRFFEPSPGRSYLAGVSANVRF
ncbi:MAG TPA: TonB-dependent receptor [Casimicrobiaceae bacterium]|nr:TonB-dependent receptor [Casimicrobiaceae bacterium]